MASISRFSDLSEEELNSLIQKAIPETTKIARKYGIKILKWEKKEFEFDTLACLALSWIPKIMV